MTKKKIKELAVLKVNTLMQKKFWASVEACDFFC